MSWPFRQSRVGRPVSPGHSRILDRSSRLNLPSLQKHGRVAGPVRFLRRAVKCFALPGVLKGGQLRLGVVEAINGNIQTLLRRGRGYKNRSSRFSALPSPRPNTPPSEKPLEMGLLSNSDSEPVYQALRPKKPAVSEPNQRKPILLMCTSKMSRS